MGRKRLLPQRERVHSRRLIWAAALLAPTFAWSQQPCANGIRVDGYVTDQTGSTIAAAQVRAADGEATTTDSTGHFLFACVPLASSTITVNAAGFNPATVPANPQKPGGQAHLAIKLTVSSVETTVQVTADSPPMSPDNSVGTRTLNAAAIQELSDDPDDLTQQLQALAASVGGGGTATMVVDGFQNGSALPPKSAIASIRINPDSFSPEYPMPTWEGGRIEITTKPGSEKYHGAVYFTDSDSSFNANDAFSTTATPAGKHRFGFELGGPIVPQKSGFFVALEKRDINEFNVVNAITLDANDQQASLQQSVSAPQRLWIASIRGDLQVTPKDSATLSFSANVNSLANQGIGGLTLPSAGYSSEVSEYDLRFSNNQIPNASLLHETRIGYTWKTTANTPNSTAPSLQVAGFFTGGGATSQDLNSQEQDLEIDDDVLITRGKQELKIGAQSLGIFVHDYDPDTFNGSYVFGGGSAPVLDADNHPTPATTNITALEQYRRATLGLAGGTPTTYQQTTGTPLVPLTQWQLALYLTDTIKITPHLTALAGMRYGLQSEPDTFANLAPRAGLSWSPDKKRDWVLHFRAGMFNAAITPSDAIQVARLNGTRQQEALVYSPSFTSPLTPVAGSILVSTLYQFPHTFEQLPIGELQVGIEHDFPHHWHPSASFSWAAAWGDPRGVNINAPLVASTNGVAPNPTAALLASRPIEPGVNINQYQNSGHNHGWDTWVGLEQSSYKHWNIDLGAWNESYRSDEGTPQSSYSKAGEYSRPAWQSSGAYVESDVKFPEKIELSTELHFHYGQPYDITTGTDANGDGDFNDRPSYASTPEAGVYSTPFGLLTTNTVNGDVPRDLGTMPAVVRSYANLSRVFNLSAKDKDHPLSLRLNARSSNFINHTNVTAVGTVVSSSNFTDALSAQTARRVELGARFSF